MATLLVVTITPAEGPPFVCAANDKAQAHREVCRHFPGRGLKEIRVDEWVERGYGTLGTHGPWVHVGTYTL